MPTHAPVHQIKPGWSAVDIPGLAGRTAVVTGASSGIGYQIARQLAAHGAHVILASRDADRAAQAARAITRNHPWPAPRHAYSTWAAWNPSTASLRGSVTATASWTCW